MPNTINLHLLDNKQIKVDMGGIPLGSENSYRIYQGEENATQFTIASKPTKYENADYYIIFINSQNKRAFLDDIIPEPIPDEGQLLTSNTFTLPIGMAVKGYGFISIYAIYENLETGKTEKVPFQTLKVKIWETIGTWKDYVTDLNTPATEEWVEQYVDNALAEIDLSGYVQKTTTIAGIDLQDNITKSELLTALNVEDGAEVNTVDSVNSKTGAVVLDTDDISDTNATNKYVSAEEKAQIGTNATDISGLQSNKLDKVPVVGYSFLDENNKITNRYLPDFVLGAMLKAGDISSLDDTTATALLTDGGKSRLGVSSNSLTLTNDTTAKTGYPDNQYNYYVIQDTSAIKDGEMLRDTNLNLLKLVPYGWDYGQQSYGGIDIEKGVTTGTIVFDGTAGGQYGPAYYKNVGKVHLTAGQTYTITAYLEDKPSGQSSAYCVLMLRTVDDTTTATELYLPQKAKSFTASVTGDYYYKIFFYEDAVYDNYLIKPAVYEGDLTADLPAYQPYLSMFAGLYFEAGDWLVATASGWGKIDNVDAVKAVNGKTGFVQLQIADIPNLQDELDNRADKVSSATSGNFAGLDSNGNLTDSGKKASDFQSKLTQSTDLTPTTQTLTLTANTRYALGTLTALDITFPASGNDGDEIIIEFVSGSTATTLTLDNVNAIYNFSSINANKFVELNAQYKLSINKWVVYSAETDYTVA